MEGSIIARRRERREKKGTQLFKKKYNEVNGRRMEKSKFDRKWARKGNYGDSVSNWPILEDNWKH